MPFKSSSGPINNNPEIDFEQACEIVEKRCRKLGKDCIISFLEDDEGVEVAPTSWGGSSVEDNLYKAIIEAEK